MWVKQPKLGVLYNDLVYKPMLELFDLLKDNGFRVFVCSGGGRDFMRASLTGRPHMTPCGRAPCGAVTHRRGHGR